MTYFIAPILRKQNYRDTRRMLNIAFREWKLMVNMLSNVKIILAKNNSICFVCESILDYDTGDKTCRVTHTQTYKIYFETFKEFNERRRKRKNIKIYNSYGRIARTLGAPRINIPLNRLPTNNLQSGGFSQYPESRRVRKICTRLYVTSAFLHCCCNVARFDLLIILF